MTQGLLFHLEAPAGRFTDIFRVVGHRTTRAGSKSIGGDVYTFRGVFRGRVLELVSTVRTITPNATFHTASNTRIDYGSGRVCADCKFVDIAVRGEASREDLEDIAALAQAEDTRPVIVRLATDPVRSGVMSHE